MEITNAMGTSTHAVMRVTSAQKLPTKPWPSVLRAAKPRASANATAMPVAAEKKFCTDRPSICVR